MTTDEQRIYNERAERLDAYRARIAELEAALAEAREDSARLITTGQAVLDRWDSPKWKDQDPTAKVMNELRAAIDAARGRP
jgi:cell division septum initiation protein DivIVA